MFRRNKFIGSNRGGKYMSRWTRDWISANKKGWMKKKDQREKKASISHTDSSIQFKLHQLHMLCLQQSFKHDWFIKKRMHRFEMGCLPSKYCWAIDLSYHDLWPDKLLPLRNLSPTIVQLSAMWRVTKFLFCDSFISSYFFIFHGSTTKIPLR